MTTPFPPLAEHGNNSYNKDMDKTDPLDRLRAWRKLNSTRTQDILAARAQGHTWEAISDASGMTRQGLLKLAKKNPS